MIPFVLVEKLPFGSKVSASWVFWCQHTCVEQRIKSNSVGFLGTRVLTVGTSSLWLSFLMAASFFKKCTTETHLEKCVSGFHNPTSGQLINLSSLCPFWGPWHWNWVPRTSFPGHYGWVWDSGCWFERDTSITVVPASREMIPDSVELCETDVCCLHIPAYWNKCSASKDTQGLLQSPSGSPAKSESWNRPQSAMLCRVFPRGQYCPKIACVMNTRKSILLLVCPHAWSCKLVDRPQNFRSSNPCQVQAVKNDLWSKLRDNSPNWFKFLPAWIDGSKLARAWGLCKVPPLSCLPFHSNRSTHFLRRVPSMSVGTTLAVCAWGLFPIPVIVVSRQREIPWFKTSSYIVQLLFHLVCIHVQYIPSIHGQEMMSGPSNINDLDQFLPHGEPYYASFQPFLMSHPTLDKKTLVFPMNDHAFPNSVLFSPIQVLKKTSSNSLSHSNPACGWTIQFFVQKSSTRSSIFCLWFRDISCRGKTYPHVPEHSDWCERWAIWGASLPIFTWVEGRYCISCLSVTIWYLQWHP